MPDAAGVKIQPIEIGNPARAVGNAFADKSAPA
jgi:hypothetical protein